MINNPRIRVYPHLKLPNGDLPTSTSKYWYFHVFDEDFETSLMEVRMTQDGYWGELVWLQKGRRVSGTEVRTHVVFLLCDFQLFVCCSNFIAPSSMGESGISVYPRTWRE